MGARGSRGTNTECRCPESDSEHCGFGGGGLCSCFTQSGLIMLLGNAVVAMAVTLAVVTVAYRADSLSRVHGLMVSILLPEPGDKYHFTVAQPDLYQYHWGRVRTLTLTMAASLTGVCGLGSNRHILICIAWRIRDQRLTVLGALRSFTWFGRGVFSAAAASR